MQVPPYNMFDSLPRGSFIDVMYLPHFKAIFHSPVTQWVGMWDVLCHSHGGIERCKTEGVVDAVPGGQGSPL